tara:strand:- start:205 stop:1056 length:852 start_codon:yes stop_codon:yes gene_type:complete
METIAGGLVLDIKPIGKWSILKSKAELLPITSKERFGFLIEYDWEKPKTKNAWESLFFVSSEILGKWIKELDIYENKNGILYTKSGFEKSKREVILLFKASYKINPFRTIISLDGILIKLKWSEEWFNFVIRKLTESNKLKFEQGGFSLKGFKPEFLPKDMDDINRIKSIISKSGIISLSIKEISDVSGFNPKRVGDLVHLLYEQSEVENLGNNFWLHRSNLNKVITRIIMFFKSNSQLTVAEFKNITGLPRKTAIPLLEYLDRNHFTERSDNVRLKGKALDG